MKRPKRTVKAHKAEHTQWLRFQLLTEDEAQIDELERVLGKYGMSRRELAIIVSRLRVRPGFQLEDF